MRHPCPVPGCGRTLPWDKLMCLAHWRMVPSGLQQRVYNAWNNGEPRPLYPSLRSQAIAAATWRSK